MPVIIESAGDHGFDLAHLRRSGGDTLVKFLLQKAGFDIQPEWRVRVNEKQHCSGMTPPVSVVRYHEWGIVLRIKPGDNNTCHNVTMLFPSGLKAAEVFHKLRSVEKGFNRNWRKMPNLGKKMTLPNQQEEIQVTPAKIVEEAPQVVTTLVPVEISEKVVEVSEKVAETVEDALKLDVTDFLSKQENIKAICLHIYEMEEMQNAPWQNSVEFTAELCKRLGVVASNSRQAGAMMRTVIFRGFVNKTFVGAKQIGYALTHKGRDFIKVDLYPELTVTDPEKVQEKKAQVSVTPQTLREIGPLAGDIFHLSSRLKDIEAERKQLQLKIDALNQEEEELCVLHNQEIESFLSRIGKR
jgi:hypothetical protein